LISEHFSQKLLSTLDEILTYRKKKEAVVSDSDSDEDREQIDYLESRWEFPQLIGSYNEYSVPALEFTKMVCQHIFGLEPAF
jgi:hypothetical protein